MAHLLIVFNFCIIAVCLLLSGRINTFMLWQHCCNLRNTESPVPCTVPAYQQAATTYCAQFGPLYILCTKEFPAALQTRDQYIEQRFYTIYFTHC